ncbi:MAG: hypothetical protein M3Q06_04545 [Bacteroidota bacterium]|nr:hypothetical protein [Bacteroidota bacterium]
MRKQLLFFMFVAFAQTALSQPDSLLFAAASGPKAAVEAGDPLFYGRQYVGYEFVIEGIPFYPTDEWQKGTITYRDVTYRDVLLKYDLVKDEVLVLHPNGYTPVILFAPRIDFFTMGEKKFVYLPALEAAPFKAGVYEEVSRGALTLYAKRSKLLSEEIVSNKIEREFVDNHSFYIRKEGKLVAANKEKVIMALVEEKKKESKALLKKDGIKFRKNPEAALRTIVTFYNQSSR